MLGPPWSFWLDLPLPRRSKRLISFKGVGGTSYIAGLIGKSRSDLKDAIVFSGVFNIVSECDKKDISVQQR